MPGDLAEKVNPYLRPLYDALHDMVDFDRAQRMLDRGAIEVAPLAFMRGRTLNDSFVILDEAQNTTPEQMKMFLTAPRLRLEGGDHRRRDPDRPAGRQALGAQGGATRCCQASRISRSCTFSERDVVRHRLVQDIITAYDRHEGRES